MTIYQFVKEGNYSKLNLINYSFSDSKLNKYYLNINELLLSRDVNTLIREKMNDLTSLSSNKYYSLFQLYLIATQICYVGDHMKDITEETRDYLNLKHKKIINRMVNYFFDNCENIDITLSIKSTLTENFDYAKYIKDFISLYSSYINNFYERIEIMLNDIRMLNTRINAFVSFSHTLHYKGKLPIKLGEIVKSKYYKISKRITSFVETSSLYNDDIVTLKELYTCFNEHYNNCFEDNLDKEELINFFKNELENTDNITVKNILKYSIIEN